MTFKIYSHEYLRNKILRWKKVENDFNNQSFIEIEYVKHNLISKIDKEDINLYFSDYWFIDTCNRKKYIFNKNKKGFHTFLFDYKKGYEVDHINGDSLDNRRCNLRLVTHSCNQKNKKKGRNNTTGYLGVLLNKKTNKYYAEVRYNGKKQRRGYFINPIDAAITRDKLALKLFGPICQLNFKEEEQICIT